MTNLEIGVAIGIAIIGVIAYIFFAKEQKKLNEEEVQEEVAVMPPPENYTASIDPFGQIIKESKAKSETATDVGKRAHEKAERALKEKEDLGIIEGTFTEEKINLPLTASNVYMEMMKRIPKATFNRRFKGNESKTLIDPVLLNQHLEQGKSIQFVANSRKHYLQHAKISIENLNYDQLALNIMELSRSACMTSTIDSGSSDKPNPFWVDENKICFFFVSRYKDGNSVVNRLKTYAKKNIALTVDSLNK